MNGIITKLVRIVNLIIPKDSKSIYFRSSFLYPDNTDAVIDTLLKETQEKYRIFCEEPNYRYEDIPNVIHVKNKIQSLLYYFRSKYVFWDIGMFGNPKPVRSQITVNLWHGVSFKKIGFYLSSVEQGYPTSTYVVTYSELFAEKMAKAFGVDKQHVLTTGEPRNDYLFKPATDEELYSIGILPDNKKIFFWMPTYRQSKYEDKSDGQEYDLGFPFLNEKNLLVLNQICEKNGIVLVLKWHALQRLPDSIDKKSLNNLVFLTSEKLSKANLGLNSVLARSDALITDYSSVFVNYMLLDRPICFAYDDIDYYRENRGFMFEDIRQYMPGMQVQTFEGLLDFICDVCGGADKYSERRSSLANVLNDFHDNNNAYRLLLFLGLV